MTHPLDPFDQPLPLAASTWTITIGNGQELNYGQMHDIIHRDIAIGNDFRKERIKLLLTLATGVFALTVTFHKDLFGSVLTYAGLYLLLSGWAMMIISLGAGIIHFRQWEDFYLEHRAQGNALWRFHVASAVANADKQREARIAFHKAGKQVADFQKSYKKWNFIQSASLVAGLVLIALYAAAAGNAALDKANSALLKSSEQGATQSSSALGASAQPSAIPAKGAAVSGSDPKR